MKEISIWFLGFWECFDNEDNFIINTLRKFYKVRLDEKNPEYLFYTRFDSAVYKYNCIRIFYNMENFSPDFNLCDYAMGFDEISFGDRYLRYPLYLITDYKYYPNDDYALDYKRALNKDKFNEEDLKRKKEFCGIVVSRGGCKEREEFFDSLSGYKKISSGGKWRNTVGGPVPDKYEFLKSSKFSIAFENSSTPGYTTEKLMQAFAAQTVPIYFGNPHIEEEFNGAAFINVHNYESYEDVVEAVRKIDEDDDLYMRMMRTPAFIDGLVERKNAQFELFLRNIVDQDKDDALRRHGPVIEKYEQMYKIGNRFYMFLLRISLFLHKLKG